MAAIVGVRKKVTERLARRLRMSIEQTNAADKNDNSNSTSGLFGVVSPLQLTDVCGNWARNWSDRERERERERSWLNWKQGKRGAKRRSKMRLTNAFNVSWEEVIWRRSKSFEYQSIKTQMTKWLDNRRMSRRKAREEEGAVAKELLCTEEKVNCEGENVWMWTKKGRTMKWRSPSSTEKKMCLF
jgi:hypothetical protein